LAVASVSFDVKEGEIFGLVLMVQEKQRFPDIDLLLQ
jgi:hypothetical protein